MVGGNKIKPSSMTSNESVSRRENDSLWTNACLRSKL